MISVQFVLQFYSVLLFRVAKNKNKRVQKRKDYARSVAKKREGERRRVAQREEQEGVR